ncbi:HAMP domain-containing sensor histidine kinase [Paenibacillus sp. AN1007]|uniref:histidine kinase n=1 Tax=Paenibacillus sp. AN1007 TaxID=3151385 RepID=A0AAU8NFX4_9BACL
MGQPGEQQMRTRSMHSSLMINYVWFTIFFALICYVVYSIMYDARDEYMNQTLPLVEADNLVREEWEEIPYETAASMGGYVQVLDENYHVVFTRGRADEESPQSYTEEELLSLFYESSDSDYYSIAPQLTKTGEKHHLLVVIPGGAIMKESRIVRTDREQTAYFVRLIVTGLIVFAAAFSLMLWLYSRITARKITLPLRAVSSRLAAVSEEEQGEHLQIKANRELMEIQLNFNRMTTRLQKAREDKRRLENDRTRMFMDISHDLKTPITTIQGYAEVLRLGLEQDDFQRKKYAGYIHRKALFIGALVQDLLELTKLENASFSFKRVQGDLSEICRTEAADLYDFFEQKGIQLDITIPDKPVLFHFHEGLFRRIIHNLLANALKYNTHGAHAWFTLEEREEGVLLTVGDDGPGISEDLAASVFDPFVRGDRARRNDGGSGLGLSIVKSAVEKHNGVVWMDRRAKGTLISIYFPF